MSKGGRRPGAGRKPLPPGGKKKAISLQLPTDILAWLDNQDQSRATLIERAVREKYGV